jgi:hypothetical protein
MLMRLIVSLMLATVMLGCGGRLKSECQEICPRIREQLISNLGVEPARVDCSDPKWVGNCAHCEKLVREEYSAQLGPEFCQ